MSGHVVALSGGVGGAKLAHGLSLVLSPADLSIVVNTGDDFRHLGLAISPDLDSVVYALAGLDDPVKGWGRRDETWQFMLALRELGGEDWFQLGDLDLAMHVERTLRLTRGETLSQVTRALCAKLGIQASVLPMTDDSVATRVRTETGWLDFQTYFVRRRCEPRVEGFEFAGVANARPLPAVLDALARPDLAAVVICPSNPYVSIDPILSVPGIRAALGRVSAPIIAVTPIIAGHAVKGPAAKMMRELGEEVSGIAVAARYAGLVDHFLLDESDALPTDPTTPKMHIARTLMRTVEDRAALARAVMTVACLPK